METTIEIIDAEVFDNIKPLNRFIPNFLRVLYATRWAVDSADWANLFSLYNSGTYSSQWMILDYKELSKSKNKPISTLTPSNMLYMIEQTPSRIISHDITAYLFHHGYFASYNRAFLEETKHDLHSAMIKNLYGSVLSSYSKSHRGSIFKHFNKQIKSLNALKALLRYNGFKEKRADDFKDPSKHHPQHAISARFDYAKKKRYSGGIDTKVVDSEMFFKKEIIAINGPTTENRHFKSFEFVDGNGGMGIRHEGIPKRIEFPYVKLGFDEFRK